MLRQPASRERMASMGAFSLGLRASPGMPTIGTYRAHCALGTACRGDWIPRMGTHMHDATTTSGWRRGADLNVLVGAAALAAGPAFGQQGACRPPALAGVARPCRSFRHALAAAKRFPIRRSSTETRPDRRARLGLLLRFIFRKIRAHDPAGCTISRHAKESTVRRALMHGGSRSPVARRC